MVGLRPGSSIFDSCIIKLNLIGARDGGGLTLGSQADLFNLSAVFDALPHPIIINPIDPANQAQK